MASKNFLRKLDHLLELAHVLQQLWQAEGASRRDRLARHIDELEEVRQLVTRSRSKAAEGIRVGRSVLRELGVAPPSLSRRLAPASPGPYTIEYLDAEPGPCIGCGTEVPLGPTAWSNAPEEGPVCDACLSDRCEPFHAVLVLANLMREIGEMDNEREQDRQGSMTFLYMMSRLFDAEKLGKWYPFPTLPTPELEQLLAKLAYCDEIADRDDAEPS